MFKKILRRFLADLGEMEGDYRVFYLKDDIAYSTLYISVAILGVLSMLGMDILLFKDRPDLFTWLVLARVVFTLVSILVIAVLWKTSRVRVFDRTILGWLIFTVLFFLLHNFTRPTNSLTTIIDVFVPFAIYIFSPLKIVSTIALAFGFSVGTIYVDHVYKAGIDPVTL